MYWPLQDAKNHFSKIVRLARSEGPQVVTKSSVRAAVVLSAADYDVLLSGRQTFVDDLLSGPSWDTAMADAVDARAQPLRTGGILASLRRAPLVDGDLELTRARDNGTSAMSRCPG
ncbi:type II toxin-antitoxin system Phd/YefM family antitoxin [Pinisolibacter sp. B13]|nr:type II toxin-antitoxin system Phd/YefM family antitoxin [Pinisolibacter aquiterrae]